MENKAITFLLFLSFISISSGQSTSGIFKMGLISCTYSDSTAAHDQGVIQVLSGLRKESEYELYFTPDECMKVSNVEQAIKKEIYDNKNDILYTLIDKGELKWYAADSFPERIFNVDHTAEIKTLLKIKVSSLPEDQKTIFGFVCNKVSLRSPENPSQSIIQYRTSENLTDVLMDPMSELIPGVLLESTVLFLFPGITPTTGAMAFTAKKFNKKHFGIKLKKYQKVTPFELESKLWDLN